MARIFPFSTLSLQPQGRPYQENLVTQPYDKISPRMQARYLSLSPYNLVRIILGQRTPEDREGNDVYTRAAGLLKD